MTKTEIKKDFRNELLKRREIELTVEAEKTPSFSEASKILSEELKVPEEQVLVEAVRGSFGRKTFLIRALIYDSKELKEEAVRRSAKKEKSPASATPSKAAGSQKN